MENQERDNQENYTIDLQHLLKSLWKHAWIIVLCGVLAAAVGLLLAAVVISPEYQASIKLYVNNSSSSSGNQSSSISQSDLNAAQSLVKTYAEMLDSRYVWERVVEKADVDFTWKEVSKMVECTSSNNTEVMLVTVTCDNPYEASDIANAIADVLAVRISEIIEGSSMKVVDPAVPDKQKVGPSVSKYTLLGFMLGAVLAAGVIVVLTLLDDTMHDEDYILKTYNYPILGTVPDLASTGNGKAYAYYRKDSRSNN